MNAGASRPRCARVIVLLIYKWNKRVMRRAHFHMADSFEPFLVIFSPLGNPGQVLSSPAQIPAKTRKTISHTAHSPSRPCARNLRKQRCNFQGDTLYGPRLPQVKSTCHHFYKVFDWPGFSCDCQPNCRHNRSITQFTLVQHEMCSQPIWPTLVCTDHRSRP